MTKTKQIVLRLTPDEFDYFEPMRTQGKEHQSMGPLVRSLLQAMIADDKAAEGLAK